MSWKTKAISVFKYAFFLATGIALLLLAFKDQNVSKIYYDIIHANFFWVGISLLVSFFAYVSRAYRWNLLIKSMGYDPGLQSSMYSLMVGYFANLAIPRIGEVSRCVSLSKAENIPFNVLLGTVIVERIIDVICLALLIFLTIALEFEHIGRFLLDKIVYPLTDKFYFFSSGKALVIGSVFLLILFVALVLIVFPGKHRENALYKKGKEQMKGVTKGIKTVINLENHFSFYFHTVFIWSMYFLMAYTCLFAIEPTSHLGPLAGLFSLVIGGVGMSAPVQGGIGAFHWLVSQGMTIFDISLADGLTYATIVHTTQTLFVILLGSISFFLLFLKSRFIRNE